MQRSSVSAVLLRRAFSTGLLMASLVTPSSAERQTPAEPLFRHAEPVPAPPGRTSPDGTEPLDAATPGDRRVRIDLGQLARMRARVAGGTPGALMLNLFDDVVFVATVTRTEPTSSGGYALTGRLEGMELGAMTLVVNGDVVAGTVHTPHVTYAIGSSGDGAYVIERTDRSLLRCVLPGDPPLSRDGSAPSRGHIAGPLPDIRAAATAGTRTDPSTDSEDGSVIDLLVVFTPAARLAGGGRERLQATIDLMVADANRALSDSGVIQRINLVHKQEVTYTEAEDGFLTDFFRLEHPADGHLDEVHGLRDRVSADLMYLVRAGPHRGGAGQILSYTGIIHHTSGGLLAHELGHNMGLRHDRYVDPSNHPFPYSHGYVNQAAFEEGAPPSSRFATMMSYNRQCTDAGFFCPWTGTFSDPDRTWNGYPMGVPGEEPSSAVDGPANARRSLNELRETVANFRVRRREPDLTPAGAAVSEVDLEPGQAFTFQATVHNYGRAAAAETTVRYYRSADPTISSADTPAGTDAVVALAAHGAMSGSVGMIAPATPGIYYYGACVDSVVGETILVNNCSAGAWATVVAGGIGTNCRSDLGPVTGTVARTGSWYGNCDWGRQYTFRLNGGDAAPVTIELASPSVNPFLRLDGGGLEGPVDGENEAGNARIRHTLSAGNYLIWATPWSGTGPFTLKIAVNVPGPFTDHPIVPGVTPVEAQHFTELRSRIDALRSQAGLGPFPWTDPDLMAGATPVRVVHLLELRSALAAAYEMAGLSAPRWTDAALVGGDPIRAVHLMELRAAVVALE